MNKNIVACFSLLILCLMHGANAIKCYQCKSLTDPNCGKNVIDVNSNIRQVDCDYAAKPNSMEQFMPVTKCNKVVTSDKAGIIISRDCHFQIVGQRDDICSVSHSRDVQSCYTCTGDLCNASSAGRLMAYGILAIFSLVAINIAF
uniref:Uncharacterized protein n=1 Tax=Glossina morsitans morsitans TaxID=37546 RepID=A0A1B0FHH1_GLOMM